MKRDAPAGQRPPAAARDGKSLRAQLSRAVGQALRAVRSAPKTAEPSRQRLTDVLWNDRSLIATQKVAEGKGATPAPDVLPQEPAFEVVSDGEVDAWFEAALEEAPSADPALEAAADLEAARAFGDALEQMAAELEREAETACVEPPTKPVVVRVPEAARRPNEPADPVTVRVRVDPRAKVQPPDPAPLPSEPVTARVPAVPASEPPRGASPPPTGAFTAPPKPTPAPEPDDDDPAHEEPIRTRSMARLLAGQGHRERALRIYDALLRTNADDASLREEAEALRNKAAS